MSETDSLGRVSGFLAVINNVAENGFFESFKFDLTDDHCTITAKGYIPIDPEDREDGCVSETNAKTLLANCKTPLFENPRQVKAKLTTKNWPMYNDDGDRIIGSMGICIDMHLSVLFQPRQ